MPQAIELILTHPRLDELTAVKGENIVMTEEAHVALVDAVAALGYEVDVEDGLTVVELDDAEVGPTTITHTVDLSGSV